MEHSSLLSPIAADPVEAASLADETVVLAEDTIANFPTPEIPETELASNLPEVQKVGLWQRYPAIQVFLSTFFTIFLAELGDKTQVTTLLMAAESHAPWVVFAGAGTALVATSLIGVWLGCWLSKRVSAQTLEKAAGVLLLLISVQLGWEVLHL